MLRFRSEGEGRGNALPIANKGCNVGRDVESADRGLEWSCTDRLVWVVRYAKPQIKNIRTVIVRMFEYSVRESNPYLETENLSS